MPPAALFQGMTFLLTHVDASERRRHAAGRLGAPLEVTSTDDSTSETGSDYDTALCCVGGVGG